MTLKIMREVTEWAVEGPQPNHVYLMQGDRAYAYVPWGRGKPQYFQRYQTINRKGRKFVEERKNPWGFAKTLPGVTDVVPEKPRGQTWTVQGSKGNSYTVSLDAGIWSCTCPGHGFRGRCRHVTELQAQPK